MLKGLFGGSKKKEPGFSEEEFERDYESKKLGMEKILGPMYPLVGHAVLPFQLGGPVDMYYFAETCEGTCMATMELLEPDGTGPKPSRIGTYELVAFTKHKVSYEPNNPKFDEIVMRMRVIFTNLARYAVDDKFNPLETVELPGSKGDPGYCVILDEYKKPGTDFLVSGRKHGLLLVIIVHRSEMIAAMKNGSVTVLDKLKDKGYYPYSDLDREPVA